ncbi:MAG: aminotransferase class IV [Flavobacteriaceae bacterium]|jgi:branched-chain amino acid aminotransferase|nr:aminotransferase class IV [Flavobacteriaceae bacterium]MDG1794565.1 aminotransferase class IV [Flavobacteriaceae bacterium]
MINFNGELLSEQHAKLSVFNRGLAYGDALFETLKTLNGKILFWEDHYFRLMASMRILRMEIPMAFTPEFLESQILELLSKQESNSNSYRVKFTVFRKEGGFYTPLTNDVAYFITAQALNKDLYLLNSSAYRVELFKDFYVTPGLLSTLKTNNKVLNVLGSVYAKENKYQNCLLLNTNKNIVEALNGNLFLVKGNVIKTPPLEDGCLKGIMRKQVIEIIKKIPDYEFEETSISPFELQKADELFVTNVIQGLQPITAYRKKIFTTSVSQNILAKLNMIVRLA